MASFASHGDIQMSKAADLRNGITLQDPRLVRQACYVNGEWIDPARSKVIEVDDPATGEIVTSVPNFGAAETRRAIDAAAAAFPAWRQRTAKERATVMRQWYE